MDFHLRYRGPLPANGSPKEKAAIREYLSPQLEDLFATARQLKNVNLSWVRVATSINNGNPQLLPLTSADFASPIGGAPDRSHSHVFYKFPIGGYTFIPLITRLHGLVCELDLTFLRREDSGAIINAGGDLDNRLKMLFDALRLPYEQKEIGRAEPPTAADIYCLLEDDVLITRIGLVTGRLLGPLHTDGTAARGTDVELHLHIHVRVTVGTFANLDFLWK